MKNNLTELLAPAGNLEAGIEAINAGADAVYTGAPKFGARKNAGNSIADIEILIKYAHQYYARVYVTLNTLLHDPEVEEAVRLSKRLYEAGADGLIIQDMGLLEAGLPPIPLIASTQTDNRNRAKIKFLQDVGFKRVILARELSLKQIKKIRTAAPDIELEFFIHGALCVSYSGQCYLSYAAGGRSANRGECAQPCRKKYDLVDSAGKMIEKGKYLLSLKDLNLSDHLADLLDAGITSFKIEGRLKSSSYVRNVVAHYRKRLDYILEARGAGKSSSGTSKADFTPDPAKSFNRGFTSYFLNGGRQKPGSINSPKMRGEFVGRVRKVMNNYFILNNKGIILTPGDGISYFNKTGELEGTSVYKFEDGKIFPEKMLNIKSGLEIFRNHDHDFHKALSSGTSSRKIDVILEVKADGSKIKVVAKDEDGNIVEPEYNNEFEKAKNREKSISAIKKQLSKSGDTIFNVSDVVIEITDIPFVPVSVLNSFRREILEKLLAERELNRPVMSPGERSADAVYPLEILDYRGNVINSFAEKFYKTHGVKETGKGAEAVPDMKDKEVMFTKYCILNELEMCKKEKKPHFKEPLFLIDESGKKLMLEFDCKECEMKVKI